MSHFNILALNIEVLYKHIDSRILEQYLTQFDNISLCETWSKNNKDFDTFLSDYTHYGNVRKIQNNVLRNSGGVSVFKKNEIVRKELVKRIYYHFEDCVVLLFKGSEFKDMKDIAMYFAYVSAEGILFMQS